ncbi:MAG: hypothetical protein ACRDMX_12465, partial [Solirubrobacteraceae bacterium]
AWIGARGPRARMRAVIGSPWPVAAAPALAFAGWHLYIQSRLGGSTLDPGTAFATPFVQFASEFHRAIHHPPLRGAWDLCYLALMLCGIVAAAALVWRRRSPVAVTALLFALTLPVLAFGDAISYTRLSAPMFACLLLEGLQRRSRGVLALCGAVALMGALLPFGVA